MYPPPDAMVASKRKLLPGFELLKGAPGTEGETLSACSVIDADDRLTFV